MVCARLIFFFSIVFMPFSALIATGEQPKVHSCSALKGTPSSGVATGTYAENIRQLLSSLSSTITANDYGFYNFSYGNNSDIVYATALCRGDTDTATCRNCIGGASQAVPTLCPDSKTAIVVYNDCILRYADSRLLGIKEITPLLRWSVDAKNVSDGNGFDQARAALLDSLKKKAAAAGDSHVKYAANETAASDNQTIYALVQCTPDISQKDCESCLSDLSGQIQSCCQNLDSSGLVYPSCNLRWATNQFYMESPITNTPPPPPAANKSATVTNRTTPPPPATRTGGSNSKDKIIRIVAPTAATPVLVLICLGIILWRKKTGHETLGNPTEEKFSLETIRKATDNFSDANKLGIGGFGIVYKL